MLAQPHKLVMIDDELDILEIMSEIVNHLFGPKVEVMTFLSSRDAWEYIQHNEIRIVMSDLHLPGIHGLDLVRQIMSLNRGIQVIAVTGDKSCSAALECFMNGVHGYINKPATMEKIQETILQCLSQLGYWQRIIEASEEI